MRIDQQQNQNANILDTLKQSIGPEEKNTEISFLQKTAENTEGVINAKSVNLSDATYLKPGTEDKETVADDIEKNATLDAEERKNQMTVLANTTSVEDYAKMQEDGFSLDSTVTNTIVTVTDKIKAELAKAGVDISIFGDDLDWEQLEAICGTPELARQLAEAMQKADVPVNEENLKDAAEAYQLANQVQEISGEAIKYMLNNQLEPTIENIYRAEFSGGMGYMTESTEEMDVSSFAKQLEDIIKQAGYPVNEQTMKDCEWLLQQQVLVTPENFAYLEELKSMAFPIEDETLINQIAEALTEGKRPQDARMLQGQDLMSIAKQVSQVIQNVADDDISYVIEHNLDMNVKNLEYAMTQRESDAAESKAAAESEAAAAMQQTAKQETIKQGESAASTDTYDEHGLALITAKRQLAEIQLMMTAESNYSMLKKGIQIDMEPIEALVEQLKAEEHSYYENLLKSQGIEATKENVTLLKETTEKVAEMKMVPAYVLGIKDAEISTINEVHKAGMAMRDKFQQANERYEMLLTAPRTDLGDSIQKAFQNIDDILEDLELDTSEANRRAVRILGYNEIDITNENVLAIKAADEEVQRVFKNLTPAVVMQMIKKGISPLDMQLEDLNAIADQLKGENEDANRQEFAEFLWKLEQNNGITEEERKSYIGIYRLIHQIETTDSAAVGALVNQGADITMRNLLMALRSEHRSGKMDYTIDESFGEAEESDYQETSIMSQIEASYQRNCLKDVKESVTPDNLRNLLSQTQDWQELTPEQLKEGLLQTDTTKEEYAYAKEQLAQLSECAKVPQDIYDILQKFDIPNTTTNTLAMEAMVHDRNQVFRQIFGKNLKTSDETVSAESFEEIKQEVLEDYENALSSPKELAEVQEKLGNLAENVMKTMIASDDVTSIDIREMRLMSAQLSIQERMAKDEQYSVPVLVGDEVVSVSLKIVRGVEKKGTVDIAMESQLRGKIAATFQAKEKGIQGFVATDNRETKELLETMDIDLKNSLQEDNTMIHYGYIDDLNVEQFSLTKIVEENPALEQENSADGEEYQIQTKRLYQLAESFIQTIRQHL